MSELHKKALRSNIGSLPPHPGGSGAGLSNTKHAMRRKKDYNPVKWSEYFSNRKVIEREGDKICAYEKGEEGPLLVLLHGGGFSALTWSLFTKEIVGIIKCRVLAIDLRGHGSTVTAGDDDLSAEKLAYDVVDTINLTYEGDPPPTILIGHSMGGAIAVHIASMNILSALIGMAVIDVVEGTAMEALANMQSYLRGRPKSFTSISNAIEWSVRTGHVRNLDSAKVSMPGQIVNSKNDLLAAEEICNEIENLSDHPSEEKYLRYDPVDAIKEEDEEEASNNEKLHEKVFKTPNSQNSSSYVWRIDLSKTEQYWSGWFSGLSEKFLSCPVAKLLLLAGVDRLDRELTIGQMQGKFQMQVLGHCGHVVHEDVPGDVADVIASFLVRNKFAEATHEFHQAVPSC